MELVCLLVQNISLSAAANKLLFRLACEMLQKKQKRRRFDSTELKFEGSIKTKFKQITFVHFRGTIFEAELDTERGKAHVKFLVNNRAPALCISAADDDLVMVGPDEDQADDSFKYN